MAFAACLAVAGCGSEAPPPVPSVPAASAVATGSAPSAVATFNPETVRLPGQGRTDVPPTSTAAPAPTGKEADRATKLTRIEVDHAWPWPGATTHLTISPDGTELVACGPDGVRRANLADGTPLPLPGSPPQAVAAAYSADGGLLAAVYGPVGAGGKTYVWKRPFDQPPLEIPGHYGPISTVAWTPTVPPLLATAGNDREILVRNPFDPAAKPIALKGHLDYVSRVVFSSDGKTLLSSGGDKTLLAWSIAQPRPLKSFRSHASAITAMALSADGTRLLSGDAAGQIFVWDTATGAVSGHVPGHATQVTDIAAAPQGPLFASCGGDRIVRIADGATRKPLAEAVGAEDYLNALAITPDGKFLIAAGEEPTIRFWKFPTAP